MEPRKLLAREAEPEECDELTAEELEEACRQFLGFVPPREMQSDMLHGSLSGCHR